MDNYGTGKVHDLPQRLVGVGQAILRWLQIGAVWLATIA